MKKRILIVEDNALVREMYRSALKPLGAELLETQRGLLAADIARREQPSLVILDLVLPDISGQEVLKLIKSAPETARIPVLAVTNSATAGDEASLKALGFAGLITKPVNIKAFCDAVAKFVAP
ncbi:MAG: response regulator [Alphaproteobacteria bacterium]|nr:response regulator [Alphaproteobacteria bacterium]